ncbi:MAG: hypothetical protein F4X16_12250 [Caldilineaceae bacterium SB0661_bin_34]|nr:hypothetical protein [Caldilineaceae bacterium SB0661_bin_34]
MSWIGMPVSGKSGWYWALSAGHHRILLQADAFGGALSAYTHRRMEDRVSKARFRIDVLEAYRETCTFSGLSQPQLVDAVSIVPGANGGNVDVTEGLCMSRLHHAAFNVNLLGVDPDGRIHVSEQLDAREAGDSFSRQLTSLAGRRISMPRTPELHPNRDLLAVRFEQFQAG